MLVYHLDTFQWTYHKKTTKKLCIFENYILEKLDFTITYMLFQPSQKLDSDLLKSPTKKDNYEEKVFLFCSDATRIVGIFLAGDHLLD